MCNVVVVGGGGDAPRPHWPAWEGCVLCYVSVVVSPPGCWWCWLTTTGCVSGCSLLVFLTADNSTLNPPSFRDSRHIQPVFLLPRSSFQLYSCGAQSGQRREIKTLESSEWTEIQYPALSAATTLLCSDYTGGSSNSPPSLSLSTQTSETKTEEVSEVHRRQPGLRCRVFC